METRWADVDFRPHRNSKKLPQVKINGSSLLAAFEDQILV